MTSAAFARVKTDAMLAAQGWNTQAPDRPGVFTPIVFGELRQPGPS